MQLRKHQIDAQERALEVTKGLAKKTIARVTPGGGKSWMASLFAKILLEKGYVDRVAWVVPRLALRLQVRNAFSQIAAPYCAREAANQYPLLGPNVQRGEVCYVTTYQSVGADQTNLHQHEFAQRRYLLILDEFHHLADREDAAWKKAMEGLHEMATHTLLMSGTAERGDREQIPLVDYVDKDGCLVMERPHIEYTRKEAIGEGAILPHDFVYVKGWARYFDCEASEDVQVNIENEPDGDRSRKAIASFLANGEYRFDLVSRAMDKWIAYRDTERHGRMLVVCHSQMAAREVKTFIEQNYQKHAVLAISDEKTGQRVLRDFRDKQKGDILVTVGMAYEGFDCPDLSHVVCLTNIRTRPWIEQVIDRSNRIGTERSTVIVPDDALMRGVLDQISRDQEEGLRIRQELERDGVGGGGESSIVPGGSGATGEAFGLLGERMGESEAGLVVALQQQFPRLHGWQPKEVLAFLRQAQAGNTMPATQSPPPMVLQDVERERRQQIENLARSRDRRKGLDWGETNKLLFRVSGKAREKMSVDELGKQLGYLAQMMEEEQNGG